MKKYIAMLGIAALCLSFCSGCAEETVTDSVQSAESEPEVSSEAVVSEVTAEEEPSSEEETRSASEPILTLEEYPTVDGSTATLPLMARVLSETCGIDEEQAESYCTASKTANAWRNLSEGSADLLLVYEAPDSVKEELEDGPQLVSTAIGRDALVFIVNEQNPVQSLSQDQLREIYSGGVTNWSELGGEDLEIVPFQRDETSGSYTLFKKLLIGDLELALLDPPTELRPTMMGVLVDGLAAYNNEGNAIGYSVYYYINEMYAQPGLRMIAVDGVQPSYDSISEGAYPLCNDFYVAIRADEPEDSPTRRLYDWICSEAGRQALIDGNYVPVSETTGLELVRMVQLGGALYLDTGRESDLYGRCGVMDGYITDQVDAAQTPVQDGQSNFGSDIGYQWVDETNIDVYIDGKWERFEKQS